MSFELRASTPTATLISSRTQCYCAAVLTYNATTQRYTTRRYPATSPYNAMCQATDLAMLPNSRVARSPHPFDGSPPRPGDPPMLAATPHQANHVADSPMTPCFLPTAPFPSRGRRRCASRSSVSSRSSLPWSQGALAGGAGLQRRPWRISHLAFILGATVAKRNTSHEP